MSTEVRERRRWRSIAEQTSTAAQGRPAVELGKSMRTKEQQRQPVMD